MENREKNHNHSITTPEGPTESYAYDKVGNLTAVTDGAGETWRYTYDRLYRLVRSTSPLGAEETYTYDKHDVVTSVTDALGNVTLYTVNANGQVEEKILPNGGSYRYAYDEVHRLTGITTPLGYETAFTYSAGNDILKQEDSLGRTTLYEYDVLHNLTKVTDPQGGVTGYTYDVRGNLESAADALGHTWSYAYDKVDRMTTVTDPEEKATAIVYDRAGNIEAITAPGGRTIRYGYDNNYNIVSLTDPMGYVYGYTYDGDDRLTGTTDPLGQTTAYRYDNVNRPVSYTDKMGLTERYAYDAHGNLLSYTAADGLVTQYTYDLMNRLTSVTDPMGSTAYYSWDSMGNLTAVTDYLGRGTSYTYDLENNLTSVTGPTGRQEVMTYDAASRITAYVSNSGNRVRYDYDKLDNLVEKAYTDAAGKESAQPVEYTYDVLGQRLTMGDSTGDTVYTYDALGRLTAVTTYRRPETEDGNGAGNSWNGGNGSGSNTGAGNNAGNNTGAGNNGTAYSREEGRGDAIGYTYDEADNLSAITYPDGTKVSYEYDLNGSLVKVTGRRGEETVYEYDALNRPVAEHRPNGISTYKVYNARNQITELTNRCDDCGWVLGHYVYTYDDRGYIVAEHAEEAREMDPYGRERYTPYAPEKQGENCDHGKNKTLSYRLLTTDSTFTYDDAGKLLTATEAEAGCSAMTVWTYSYDLMGNLSEKAQYKAENFTEISKMDAISSEKYVYNENNQLAEAVICDGKTTRKVQYTYDADGNLIQEYSPTDRSLTTYSYTVENRLEAVYTGNAYNKTLQMAAAYDGDGNRVYQLNYNPDKDEDFSDYYCSDNNCDYNGTGIQLLAEKEISQAEKDLMALMVASGAVRNSQYELIEYLNDVNREYAEVLVEQNINGRVDTAYTYGNERISWEMFNQTSRTAYYLYDPRGSVSGLTDAEGHLTKTYRYSANGELTFGGATYENEYTYNGESYNPNIQSQYLRARYYDVTAARFLTEDSYLGNIVQPLTLNRYNYCVSSWLNYRDPSGNKAIWEWLKNWFVKTGVQSTGEKKDIYKAKLLLKEKRLQENVIPNIEETSVENTFESQQPVDPPKVTSSPVPITIEDQMQSAIENSNTDVCENPYEIFSMDDYDALLGFAGESRNYEGFVAVAYVVLNRALKDGKTITEIGESKQFGGYKSEYDINQIEDEVKQAAKDVLTGTAENPIGDAYYFFGKIKGYDLWVELDGCSYVKVVKGNVFYNEYGKVHNKKPFSDFDPEKQLVIYNASLEENKWIYDGLIIKNGEVVVNRNVEAEKK